MNTKSLNKLEEEVRNIEEQNRKEDEDIAWNKSHFKKIILSVFVFIVLGITLQFSHYSNSWFNALIVAVVFLLLLYSLEFAKSLWEKNIHKDN